ncbi:hypothetical protein ACNOYE_16550 [Nannocystaceae bacterium ST9]
MSAAETPTADRAEPRAGQFLLGLVALIVLLDLILAAVPRTSAGELVEGPDGVRDQIAAAADDDRQAWLLIGDSVLVGNTGKAELPDWYEHRVVDYLEREAGEHEQVGFHQVALSGLLPIDMVEIVEELDLRDPEGEVALIIEVSPRFFSSAYVEQVEHSRPWLAELGEAEGGSLLTPIDALLRWLRRVTPLYRHRVLFEAKRDQLALPELVPSLAPSELAGEGDDQGGSRLEALARLRVHYRDPDLDPASAQAGALRTIAERCRASKRKVVFFATPIEDGFYDALLTGEQQGDYLGDLAGLLAPDGSNIALLPMDHPVFASPMFWDHVHLRPEGHRLLAINLLEQIGVGLERLPRREELIGAIGVDASLVARLGSGYSDGAAWQAQFDHPEGIAVSADGRRVIVTDTKNQVLRELVGDMRVVRTVAGTPGQTGSDDGMAALLDRPRSPVFVGAQVYFADGDGRRLRRLVEDGSVETLAELEGNWRITALRSQGERLYLLESNGSLTRIGSRALDGGDAKVRVVGHAGPAQTITAFTPEPEGGLYLATGAGQLLRARAVESLAKPLDLRQVGLAGAPLELLYANEGSEVLPQGKSDTFPYTFDKIRFSEIVELQYVSRYRGLLVVDLAPHGPGKFDKRVTERAHVRFIDLDKRLVYPWLKPLVAGIGYFYKNKNTDGISSYYHEGALALHQDTATLLWLEHDRSRLLRLDDGMLGVAKIGDVNFSIFGFRDVLTSAAGQRAFLDFRPDQHIDERDDLLALREDYTMLLVGSSLLAMSDMTGQYSLGRRLADQLGFDLGVRDRVSLETFHRTIPGGSLPSQIKAVSTFIKEGGRPDVILIEANASTFLKEEHDEAFMIEKLESLDKHARKWNSKLIIFDATPYIARNRDALRPGPAKVARFLELARARGVTVIDVGDLVLDSHLSVAPFASPPIRDIHMAPWAIDVVADRVAAALGPILRAELRGRTPARSGLAQAAATQPRARPLADAFGEKSRVWAAALARIPAAALQTSYEDGHLEVFIDLGQLPAEFAVDEADLDPLILACVYEYAIRQSNGARSANIKVVRFGQYDEYGAGVAEGATVIRKIELNRESLVKLIRAYDKKLSGGVGEDEPEPEPAPVEPEPQEDEDDEDESAGDESAGDESAGESAGDESGEPSDGPPARAPTPDPK